MGQSRMAVIFSDGLEADRTKPLAHGGPKVAIVLDNQNTPVLSRSRHGVQSATPHVVQREPIRSTDRRLQPACLMPPDHLIAGPMSPCFRLRVWVGCDRAICFVRSDSTGSADRRFLRS